MPKTDPTPAARRPTTSSPRAEAARYLKLPLRTINEYSAQGRVPSVKLGRHRRYSRRDLEALVAKGGDR